MTCREAFASPRFARIVNCDPLRLRTVVAGGQGAYALLPEERRPVSMRWQRLSLSSFVTVGRIPHRFWRPIAGEFGVTAPSGYALIANSHLTSAAKAFPRIGDIDGTPVRPLVSTQSKISERRRG
jgi:hypothetical protein